MRKRRGVLRMTIKQLVLIIMMMMMTTSMTIKVQPLHQAGRFFPSATASQLTTHHSENGPLGMFVSGPTLAMHWLKFQA
jgi:hypothetical protein